MATEQEFQQLLDSLRASPEEEVKNEVTNETPEEVDNPLEEKDDFSKRLEEAKKLRAVRKNTKPSPVSKLSDPTITKTEELPVSKLDDPNLPETIDTLQVDMELSQKDPSLGEKLANRFENIVDISTRQEAGETSIFGGLQVLGEGAGLIADVGGSAIKTIDNVASNIPLLGAIYKGGKNLGKEAIEEAGKAVLPMLQSTAFDPEGKMTVLESLGVMNERFEQLPEESQRNIKGLVQFLEVASSGYAAGQGVNLLKGGVGALKNTLPSRKWKGVKKVVGSVDDALPVVSAPTASRKTLATFEPADIKRLQGNPSKTKKYVDQALKGVVDDTVSSPMAMAVDDANGIIGKLKKELGSTGKKIGFTRKKLATFKADPNDIQEVIDAFDNSLVEQGLQFKGGKYTALKSRVPKYSPKEMDELLQMRSELQALKGDPKLIRNIDVTNKVRADINFKKSAKEVSDNLDPQMRLISSKLKDVSRKLVGKEKVGDLDKFMELSGFVEEVDRFSSKGKNIEFLLKRAFSERDKIPKELAMAIQEVTGDDILDSFRISQIVSQNIKNPKNMSLLEQSGLNAANIITKGKAGVLANTGKMVQEGVSILKGESIPLEDAKRMAKLLLEATE